MALPISRDTTYVDGTGNFSAADLNDIQDQIISLNKVRAGGDFSLTDDFTGSAISAALWNTSTGCTTLSTPDLDALGVCKIDSTAGSAGVLTSLMSPGTRDFTLTFLARFPNYATAAAADIIMGLYDATTPANSVYFEVFRSGGATNNVAVFRNNAQVITTTPVVTGAYTFFQIIRTSANTLLNFLINGTSVSSVAYTQNIIGGTTVFTALSATTGTSGIFNLDLAKCFIKRAY